ncbi:hypothetical protein [Streptomyces roseochromogenus]|uniref:Gram-positive cocci surface proteins LPxTG domain-containing protein n=1 Tax=Streptomyces roseochromogenus subsp. oscitans DS 12.976 TaxID=1352936 RepID=V6KAX5_STRRC|nr:hypothetical protein [Streptomyces roseochromogenus]EST29173.1 hypothetical protein M878_21175 [Streptomyces roseochromogenus subsp. oscitans DS 12.976]
MTPWLRITLRCIRLLLVLATTLPAYDTATAYATAPGPGSPARGSRAEPKHLHRPDPPDHAEATPRDPPDGLAPDPADPADHAHDQAPGHNHDHDPWDSPATSPSLTPIPTDSASASYRPVPTVEPTRAGSRAGEGRMRPGRPDGPAAEVEGEDDPVPTQARGTGRPEEPETANLPSATPTPSDAPGQAGLQPPARNGGRQGETATEPVLQILPLGTGLVLIGLGLALAFLGLKLRKD